MKQIFIPFSTDCTEIITYLLISNFYSSHVGAFLENVPVCTKWSMLPVTGQLLYGFGHLINIYPIISLKINHLHNWHPICLTSTKEIYLL